MKRMNVLKEKYKYVKISDDLDTALMYHISLIKSFRGVYSFIHTVDFFRATFKNQFEDFDEFLEYGIFLMLEDGCRVGTKIKEDPINTLLDGTVIDYNLSNDENARLIVSSWNKSLEMYPVEKIGDKNHCKLATLNIFLLSFLHYYI